MDKQHFAIDRKYGRIETEIPCRIGLPGNQLCDATVLNLSMGGLKVACNLETYKAVIPKDQRTPGQVSDVHVTVSFSMRPINRRAMKLQFTGMVIHSERLAQDSYHIGIQFTDMRKTDSNRLEDYISEIIATRD